MKTNSFFKNTIFILIISLIIKILGLINKIITTKILGVEGMSLYVLTMPTIILLTSISSLSLNSVMSKLVSENMVTKKHSIKKLITCGIICSLIISIVSIVILLCFIKPLTFTLLNNDKLLFPILTSIILIPLVGISDCLRGYFNGIKSMKHASISTLIEQITRIISTTIFIILTINKNIILSVSLCVVGLAIGEIASIIYTIIIIRINKIDDISSTNNCLEAVLKEAIPTTLSRLISSITHFLEPIIYTNILLFLLYDQDYINLTYTTITAYVIPFVTLSSFVSNAISTSIIPAISESYTKQKYTSVHYYIDKAICFALVPGLFSCIIFYLFSKEYLMLLFSTTNGVEIIKYTVLLTMPYYLQMPFTSVLQATGKNKQLFILSVVLNILKLLFILLLSFIPNINAYSIIVSLIIVINLDVIIMFFYIKKILKYKINTNELLSIILQFIFIFILTYLMKTININYLLCTLISMIITIFSSMKLKLLNKEQLLSFIKKKNLD